MYSYNITFIVEPQNENELIAYIRGLLRQLFSADSKAFNPELRKVVEAGGEKIGYGGPLSIALAASFNSEDEAYRWHDHILLPALDNFNLKFGKDAVFFISLLEHIVVNA